MWLDIISNHIYILSFILCSIYIIYIKYSTSK
nr:MAG TPA: hypothetical protein [Caudoviricetes sp.]